MDDPRASAIQAIIEPILADHRMELVEFTCRPSGRQLQVRVLVDRVGGVTIQQCARANQAIGEALDAANVIEESYTVEVSSPGLDRPLARKHDFERAIGEEVRLEAQVEAGRTATYTGMVLAVQHEAVVLKTSGGNVTVPFDRIRHAQKALRWSR